MLGVIGGSGFYSFFGSDARTISLVEGLCSQVRGNLIEVSGQLLRAWEERGGFG